MEVFNIYNDIAERTGGDIYIGVVGPVRTGKSTFIKKFMELLVLPNIEDKHVSQRVKDELPQCGGGKTIMTTEPKFVPDEGTRISVAEGIDLKVRLVDCVGYTVEGALGYEDDEGPRMVLTPWYDHEIPFQEAAELGTEKVIKEHSTIGLVVITDGTITEIPRENYLFPEEKVITELKEMGKPFLVALNSTHPEAEETVKLAKSLMDVYGVPVIPVDCLNLNRQDITLLLQEVLYEFPVREMMVNLPLWMDELEEDHWLAQEYSNSIPMAAKDVYKVRDIYTFVDLLSESEHTQEVHLKEVDLGKGYATVDIGLQETLFYKIMEEYTGLDIQNELNLFRLVRDLSTAKREYDLISTALRNVREKGYGIVSPRLEDMYFEEPQLFKKGNQFGVKLRASAPSIHLLRADISAEVSPVVGTEKQSEELLNHLVQEFEDNPAAIWDSGFLGRSLHDLVKDGIKSKIYRLPENVQEKMQETLQKIINEGSGGLICIIL